MGFRGVSIIVFGIMGCLCARPPGSRSCYPAGRAGGLRSAPLSRVRHQKRIRSSTGTGCCLCDSNGALCVLLSSCCFQHSADLPCFAVASIAIDSYFWHETLFWPELSSLVFNVYHGHSQEWGVEPFHTYFTKHLPKIMLLAYPWAWLGLLNVGGAARLAMPQFAAVGFVSLLKHKEWRFIIYAVPLLNLSAVRALWSM